MKKKLTLDEFDRMIENIPDIPSTDEEGRIEIPIIKITPKEVKETLSI